MRAEDIEINATVMPVRDLETRFGTLPKGVALVVAIEVGTARNGNGFWAHPVAGTPIMYDLLPEEVEPYRP